jgi:hypothetical protein
MRWAEYVDSMGRKGMHVKFWPEIQKERDHCEDVDKVGGYY